MSVKEKLHELIARAAGDGAQFAIAVPPRSDFGHYSTNAAMRLAKAQKKNSLELARVLAAKIKKDAPEGFLENVEAAPPGFVNFWLTKEAIREELRTAAKGMLLPKNGRGKTIIVEYSQPNIAKKMHVGHLRTTVLGDALANIYEALGYKVIRWNYLGDWGTQFGKLIAAYKLWGSEAEVRRNPITTLFDLYVRFHDEMKKDASIEDKGREEFRKLEEGNAENRKLWEWFKAESLAEFHRTYGALGVKFDLEIGESFFEPEMKPLVEELVQKGIAVKSEGSLIIPLEKEGLPPALVQKADGASLYLSRDIENLRYRLKIYKPAKILYVVGNEQSLHFEQLFAVAKILGLDSAELAHVKYGLVLAEEGKKFATREGRAVFLDDVVEKAVRLARSIVEQKNKGLSGAEKEAIARAVAVGALKYANLKENRLSDISFNWKQMLDFSGDSAPYIQYTHARLRSILRKAPFSLFGGDPKHLETETELAIVRKLLEFPDVVAAGAREYQPNLLCTYLYELANAVNGFYESTPILSDTDASRKRARLLLVETTAKVLKRGLLLLGIQALDKI